MDEELDSMGLPTLIRPSGVSLPQDTRALSLKNTGSKCAGGCREMVEDEVVEEAEEPRLFAPDLTEPLVQEPVEFLSNYRKQKTKQIPSTRTS